MTLHHLYVHTLHHIQHMYLCTLDGYSMSGTHLIYALWLLILQKYYITEICQLVVASLMHNQLCIYAIVLSI